MSDFFKFDDPISNNHFHSLGFLEWIIPITIVYTIIMVFFIYKNKIRNDEKVEHQIRYSLGFILVINLLLYYFFLWKSEGIHLSNLPLQLFGISMILNIVLAFKKVKPLYFILVYITLIIGLMNMLFNQVGYSFEYLRYYLFMLGNGLMIIIPLFYLIIYEYIPTLRNTIISFICTQVFIFFMFLFNVVFNTRYLYLVIDNGPLLKGHLISFLGSWPQNYIYLELIIIAIYILEHLLFKYLTLKNIKSNQSVVSSSYITKKQSGFYGKKK